MLQLQVEVLLPLGLLPSVLVLVQVSVLLPVVQVQASVLLPEPQLLLVPQPVPGLDSELE
eukprot:COSAG02_NODE_49313_length_327_cov_1.328947_1_plen_60_part_00